MKKLVVINLGSTSTKIAYFEDAKIVFSASLSHPAEEIQAFASNWDQYDYRKSAILGFMEQHGIVLTRAGCLCQPRRPHGTGAQRRLPHHAENA